MRRVYGPRTEHTACGSRLAKFRPPPPLSFTYKRETRTTGRRNLGTYFETTRPLDARFASWLANSSLAAVGYHLSCGLTLPESEEISHGLGPDWQGRALAAVLREC